MKSTIMEQEAKETASVLETQVVRNDSKVKELAQHLSVTKPNMVMVIGRGSSDHAGVFAKYLIEVELNIPTFAAAPSVSSVFHKQLQLKGAVAIIISQSGKSPDILSQAKMAKSGGAYCIALVNDEVSPLADIVDTVLPLCAGKEVSVAATKSYLATLSALVHLVSLWSKNDRLYEEFKALPSALLKVVSEKEALRSVDIESISNLVVLGRGFGYAISKEIALKLKEVCCIHAEAFSSAEFLHGPITLTGSGLTILNCCINDESQPSHLQQISEVLDRKARVVDLGYGGIKVHPRLTPFLILQRFYIDIARISVHMGLDPDKPLGLNKVTETI